MASDNNIESAQQTYGGFLNLLKFGTIVSVIAVAIVIALIA
ncbi:MAG: aa3-type cytochrome c oxidase subunit IV [Novosphingobium sp.]